jgi:heterodisulfide reductase subunit A-like polyferredoxin
MRNDCATDDHTEILKETTLKTKISRALIERAAIAKDDAWLHEKRYKYM